jgi:hypothetical protein
MSKYIVWRNLGYEGWSKSDDLDTLDEVFEYIRDNNYGQKYLITKTVDVEFKEIEDNAS